jgi:hypothetical protein
VNRTIALLMGSLMLLSACNASVDSPSPTTTPSSALASPRPGSDANDVTNYFSIEEVGLGPNGYVTLLNYTDVPASLDTLLLCQPAGCVDLPDVVVEPGEVARIAVGDGEGLEKVVMTGARLALTPADGEIAIYHADDLRNPDEVRHYIQWGSTPHELTMVAVAAGLWREDGFAPSGPSATRLWKRDGGWWVWDSSE